MHASTTLRKLVLAAVIVCMGCATSAVATDWTIGRAPHQVGFQDWTMHQVDSRDPDTIPPSTQVLCGFVRFSVPLPFWATVSIAAAMPLCGVVAVFLIASWFSRRRQDEATA